MNAALVGSAVFFRIVVSNLAGLARRKKTPLSDEAYVTSLARTLGY